MSDFIPVNAPLLDGNEKKYLNECIDTGWISSEGPFVRQFEERFAARVGRRYGVAVSNGSVALEVAVAALKIGSGDEVILPTFTIISCAAAIVRAGARPVLVDSDPATWNMDVNQIRCEDHRPHAGHHGGAHLWVAGGHGRCILACRGIRPQDHRGCRRDARPNLSGQTLRQLRRHQHLQLLSRTSTSPPAKAA